MNNAPIQFVIPTYRLRELLALSKPRDVRVIRQLDLARDASLASTTALARVAAAYREFAGEHRLPSSR